jgi:hypothetical protein
MLLKNLIGLIREVTYLKFKFLNECANLTEHSIYSTQIYFNKLQKSTCSEEVPGPYFVSPTSSSITNRLLCKHTFHWRERGMQ